MYVIMVIIDVKTFWKKIESSIWCSSGRLKGLVIGRLQVRDPFWTSILPSALTLRTSMQSPVMIGKFVIEG